MPILFRNDDILLVNPITGAMKNAIRRKTYEEWFYEIDEIFERYNCPSTLAVLSEGIERYPQWIEYIKERKHRFNIQLHGEGHGYYMKMSEEEGYEILSRATERIERTFDIKVTHWYVPFGRLFFPEWGPRVCRRMEIRFNSKGDSREFFQHRFHYWNTRDTRNLKKLIADNAHQAILKPWPPIHGNN